MGDTRGLGLLLVVCFLVSVLLAQVCSFCENPSGNTVKTEGMSYLNVKNNNRDNTQKAPPPNHERHEEGEEGERRLERSQHACLSGHKLQLMATRSLRLLCRLARIWGWAAGHVQHHPGSLQEPVMQAPSTHMTVETPKSQTCLRSHSQCVCQRWGLSCDQ